MIDEEKLEKLLEDNYGSLYAELQFTPIDEFIAKNKDELMSVPGFLDLYNQSMSAPHGMTSEQIDSYFDTAAEKDAYRKYEAEYQKQLKDKEKDVAEYDPEKERRRQLVNEYQHDYMLLPPAGDWLANKLADLVISPATKEAIIEQKSTPEIMTRGASDIVAAGLDAYPGAGLVGKGISYLAGPTIRSINRATSDKDFEFADYAKDYGTNAVLGEGIRGLAGIKDLGPIQKVLDKIPLNKWYEMVKAAAGSKLRKLTLPKEGEEIGDFLNRIPMSERELYLDEASKAMVESVKESAKKSKLSDEAIHDLAKDDARRAIISKQRDETLEGAKNLYKDAWNTNWLYDHPAKAMVGGTYGGGTQAVEEGIARKALEPEGNARERKQKRDSALDYIIKENERMWKAGFKPNGGIELQAWRKWKGIE